MGFRGSSASNELRCITYGGLIFRFHAGAEALELRRFISVIQSPKPALAMTMDSLNNQELR